MFFKRKCRTAPALTPETSNAAAAAAAFKALRALNANATAKAELVALGIAPSRISALYPDSEFAEIALSLSAKLPQLSPAVLATFTREVTGR